MLENKTKKNNHFKKLPHKKLFAFTLAEILLVFAFIGVIATAYTIDTQSKIDITEKKHLTYNLFKTLDLAAQEMARENNNLVPDDGVTFCNSLADLINTIGDIKCDSSMATFGTDFRTPNFVASNGMRFYNVAVEPIADISEGSKLLSDDDLKILNNKALNEANKEINSVMNVIGSEAESKAKNNLPARNYTVKAKYSKFETASPQAFSNDYGSYNIHSYNYSVGYEHNGKTLSITKPKAYDVDSTCFDIVNVLDQTFYDVLGSVTYCSNVRASYDENISVGSNGNYGNIKNLIDQIYDEEEKEKINKAINEAKSEGRKEQELDKLYQKYYNQFFQEKYKEKVASLPKVHNIYVDINGTKGKSKLNEDVYLFLIRRDGKALPAKNSPVANTNNIVSVTYYTRTRNPLSGRLPFREAACRTATFDYTDYLPNGYCEGYSVDTERCPRANSCYYKIDQPRNLWSLF